ncbi:MAG: nicotinate-nucleotide--dimethylbenzimidazole phosphoribosyltransferase [Eubacterium sp.]
MSQELEELYNKVMERLGRIRPLDEEAMDAARERERSLAKVPGSLGRLEDIAVQIAGITGRPQGNPLKKQAVLLMSADHGVAAEGVASAPQTVTTSQTVNFTRRITGIGSLAKYFDINLLVTDLGMRIPAPPEYYTDQMLTDDGKISRKIVNRRLAAGTKDLLKEPAMSEEQVLRAVLAGMEAADAAVSAGIQLLGVGEMGIGNTTPSSALLCCLTGIPAEKLVGRGGGLNDEGLKRKVQVVRDSVERCMAEAGHGLQDFLSQVKGKTVKTPISELPAGAADTFTAGAATANGRENRSVRMDTAEAEIPENGSAAKNGSESRTGSANEQADLAGDCGQADSSQFLEFRADAGLELLRQLGGFEIAAMAGAYLSAAAHRIPTVVDGFISAAAALAACEIVPETADYLFASHCSTEPGYLAAVSAMGLHPSLDLQMRLGEGSGCPLMFKIMEAACATMDLMGTLKEGQIDSGYLDKMTKHDYTGGADSQKNSQRS